MRTIRVRGPVSSSRNSSNSSTETEDKKKWEEKEKTNENIEINATMCARVFLFIPTHYTNFGVRFLVWRHEEGDNNAKLFRSEAVNGREVVIVSNIERMRKAECFFLFFLVEIANSRVESTTKTVNSPLAHQTQWRPGTEREETTFYAAQN